jgi:uncharacterized membrane protein YccC
MSLKAFRTRLATGPNRIALSTALRGTIATVTPLVVLPLLGVGAAAEFAVIGALNTSMVDVGGPYRNRLIAMTVNTLLAPCLMLVGMATAAHWWLAAPAMLVVALGGGLVRAFGPGGTSLGLNNAIAFLIGLEVSGSLGSGIEWALGYVAGGLWTILLTLGFWQLRPYRRLEQEVASAWEAVAALIAASRPADAGTVSVVMRQRRERRIAQRHRAMREAIERARTALGEVRAATHGPGTTLAQLLVLLRAASRIGAAMVTLDAVEGAAVIHEDDIHAVVTDAVDELEKVCRATARLMLAGRGDIDVEPVRRRLAMLTSVADRARRGETAATERALDAQILAFAQAVRHLNNAEEAAQQIFGSGRRLPHLALPPLAGPPLGEAIAAFKTQLTLKSAIFRHALRVAVVAAAGTAVIIRLGVEHGIWLPMTALIILQPDYGGTLSRAVQRTLGTMAGAVLAGLLLATLHGTTAFEAAIAVLLFATFLLLRRRYGLAVTFLTPLIILLLGLSGPDPWLDLRDRILDTLAGALMATVAGYALWPLWERETLPGRMARAIRTARNYVVAVLDALGGGASSAQALADLRRDAEIEAANADAAFQRMLAEPSRQRGPVAQGFTLDTYIQRLVRHTLALASHLGATTVAAEDAQALRQVLGGALEDIAGALAEGRPPKPRPDLDQPLERLRHALAGRDGETAGGTIAFLLGQIVSDTTSLHFAAGMK